MVRAGAATAHDLRREPRLAKSKHDAFDATPLLADLGEPVGVGRHVLKVPVVGLNAPVCQVRRIRNRSGKSHRRVLARDASASLPNIHVDEDSERLAHMSGSGIEIARVFRIVSDRYEPFGLGMDRHQLQRRAGQADRTGLDQPSADT